MKRVVPDVRAILFALLIITSSYKSFSQSVTFANGRAEVGLGLGPLIFLGDLGGAAGLGRPFIKDIDYPLTKLAKGIFVGYAPREWLGFRLAANWGTLDGDDKQAPNKGGDEVTRLERNLNFTTKLVEGYLGAEFYPSVFLERYDGLKGKLRPYGIVGIGVFHFNPKTQTDAGQWVYLQPLHTEGEGFAEYPDRKEYKLTEMEIPMGFGFKYYLKENMFIGLEIMHRKLFTDYIDDVSTTYIDPALFDKYLSPADAALAKELNYRGTYSSVSRPSDVIGAKRGDPKQNDAYFSTIIRLGWRLNSMSNAERQLRCPLYY